MLLENKSILMPPYQKVIPTQNYWIKKIVYIFVFNFFYVHVFCYYLIAFNENFLFCTFICASLLSYGDEVILNLKLKKHADFCGLSCSIFLTSIIKFSLHWEPTWNTCLMKEQRLLQVVRSWSTCISTGTSVQYMCACIQKWLKMHKSYL